MTEAEWLAADDPTPMLRFLRNSDRASERKLRLFACACCRRVWHLLVDGRSRRAVEIAEAFVDGQVRPGGTCFRAAQAAHVASGEVRHPAPKAINPRGAAYDHQAQVTAAMAAAAVLQESSVWGVVTAAQMAASHASSSAVIATKYVARSKGAAGRPSAKRERAAHSHLLRDLFGPLPFRPVTVAAAWLAWNDGTVRRLAEAIYAERTFDRIPVLADALEEAGCDDADILAHCRQQGAVHVRGCWVLDAVLRRA